MLDEQRYATPCDLSAVDVCHPIRNQSLKRRCDRTRLASPNNHGEDEPQQAMHRLWHFWHSGGYDDCAFGMQFDSLALGCLKAGRGEEAEQLFDERDYL